MRRNAGWRRLAGFWVAIIVLGAGGAVALQIMGPPPMPLPAPVPVLTPPAPAAPAAAAHNAARPEEARVQPAPPAPGVIRAPDPALLEPAPDFPDHFLPRRAADGRASMSFYARAPDLTPKRPSVAMLVVGLGQSEADSQAAIATLPGAVTLGFSPYSPNPDPLLASAREHGHEYLVTLPMESQGYPLNDSGPHALLTGADPAVNERNLEWVLSRMQGEVGLTGASDGLRGERFASATALMGPVMQQLQARGLLYVDPRPGAPDGPRTAVVSMVIDDPPDHASIDLKLSQLEQQARDGQVMLGVAVTLRPVTVERVAAWARGLDGRGMTLLPVSAVAVAK
jgi:polysaccharide deacetylase 2 family uncharacterized protein YibQ